jgi:hypothetical protein
MAETKPISVPPSGLYRYQPPTAPPQPDKVDQRIDPDQWVGLPQPDGSLRLLRYSEAVKAGVAAESISLSPVQQARGLIERQADATLRARRRDKVVRLLGLLDRQAHNVRLTDDEAIELTQLARETGRQLETDLADAMRAVEAEKFLQQHPDIDDETQRVETKIGELETKLQNFLGTIRNEAAPHHRRREQLLALISEEKRHQSNLTSWRKQLEPQ